MAYVETIEQFHSCAQVVAALPSANNPSGEDRLALETKKFWDNGSELIVNMWGQSDYVRSKIIQYANEWSLYANLTFKFMDRDAPGDSDIRVSFNPGGSWSSIGTTAKTVSQSDPTMNFGWFDDDTQEDEFSRTVIHEFGHAIGCIHEQSSPVANIPWNKPVVYEYYEKVYGWDKARVDRNVLNVIAQEDTENTRYDPTSIMQYPFPPGHTLDGSSAGWNRVMSNLDKTFIMRCYPKEGIVRNTQDGVYLVNRIKGDQKASGIAYYSHFGNNDGQQPDVYLEVSNNDFTWWENGGQATFVNGPKIKWTMADDAGRSPLFTRVGFAERGGEKWNVYRDEYRVLYESDGWQVYALFWAF